MQPEETAAPGRPAPVQYAAEPAAAPPGGTLAIGDPGSWAILAFSATSLLLGLFNSSAIDANGSAVIIPVAFVLGGVVQLIAAVLEVVRGNIFGAVVFGSFGPFWVIYALIENSYAGKVAIAGAAAKDANAVPSALLAFLIMYAALVFIFMIAALRTDVVILTVVVLVEVVIVLLMVGIYGAHPEATKISGIVTIVFAALGLYRGGADLVAFTFKHPVLPVGHLHAG